MGVRMHDVIQRLLQGGLTGVDLLWTFVSHRIQPLHQCEMSMWMYPGSCCPNRPFSIELSDMEINTCIWEILSHGADLYFLSGQVHLSEGVDSPWVSPLKFTYV
jgi:hypothetical protein